MEINKQQKIWLAALRITTGWLFFYAGLTKILNPEWTAGGYLKGAKTFTGLYQWLASDGILPIVDFLNEWGLLLIGVGLILGIGVRWAGILGAIMMVLYYFPVLEPGFKIAHGLVVDEHLIYASGLLVLSYFRAGSAFGLESWFARTFPSIHRWIG